MYMLDSPPLYLHVQSHLRLPDHRERSPLHQHHLSPSHMSARHTQSLPHLSSYQEIQVPAPPLPGLVGTHSSEDTLTALNKLLRPPPVFDKMLTPVEERPSEVEENTKGDGLPEEDEDRIVSSESRKLDHAPLSRSTSGLSNPSVGGTADLESESSSMRDYDPEVSSISNLSGAGILSGGFDVPPAQILSSSHSLDMLDSSHGSESFKEDITRILGGNEESKEARDSSQGSDDSSPFSSENVKALLDRERSPPISPHTPSFSSSGEGTPIRTTMPAIRRRRSSNEFTQYSSELSYPSLISPRHFPLRRHPYPARNASMDSYLRQYASELSNTGSPHSSNLSSISRATMSSQGSFSETLGDELSSRDTSSVQNIEPEPERRDLAMSRDSERGESKEEESGVDAEVEVNSSEANGTDRSQDSNTTLLDVGEGATLSAVATSNQQESERQGQDNEASELPLPGSHEQNGEVSSGSEEGEDRKGGEKRRGGQEKRLQLVRGAHRHMDSGIEEAESKLESVNSLESEDTGEDIPLPDESKPLRHYATIFASRESGLADSPDLYAIEHAKHSLESDGYPRRASHTDSSASKVSRPSLAESQTSSTFDVGPDILTLTVDLEEVGDETTEPETSLDSKSFSRELGQFSELESSLDRKYSARSTSREEGGKTPLCCTGDEGREKGGVSRGRSSSKPESDSVVSPGPRGSAGKTKRRRFGSDRSRSLSSSSPPQFTVGSPPPQLPDPLSPEASDNPPDRFLSSSVGGSSWSSRKKRRVKPAVRLLKISPNQSNPPNQSSQSGLESATALQERTDSYEVQMARVRMTTPDTPLRQPSPEPHGLRRSQSHELLVKDNLSSGNQKPTRALFISPASNTFVRSPHTQSATSSVDVEPSQRVGIDSTPKSPRGRKHSRTPQFV